MKISPMSKNKPKRSAAHAFTLIELLVVIAVIAILAALLLPALGRVKTSSNQMKATANLRQAGVAMLSFANENQGRLPGPAPVGIHCYYDKSGKSSTSTVLVVAQMAQYLGLPDPSTLNTGVKVLVPSLVDPGFAAVIRDPTTAPPYVQNLNLVFPEDAPGTSKHHILGQLASGASPREEPPTLMKVAGIGGLSKTWVLSCNDQKLPKTMNNGSGWIPLLPPTPVYKTHRLRLYVDGHVEAVPLDAPLL
jgi:prepilin-type N-terminal cleavage/methylation domain-containing protein